MFFQNIFALLILTLLLIENCCCKNLDILILHTNDMHARFEETAIQSGTCRKSDKGKNCVGGFGRVLHVVKEARRMALESGDDDFRVLFLNAGDTYAGTAWYGVHKWKIVAEFLNLLQPDAASLGNHEFDNGVSGLVPLVKAVIFPIVAANLGFSREPTLKSTNVTKSVILDVAGRKVGIIGYLTTETQYISLPGNVVFYDEVLSIKEESERLDKKGVKIIIALGHSGYKIDQKIAKEVPLVDLVIGGHTNTFLWNGPAPSTETPTDVYPKIVIQSDGKKVPVVQAYAYTKYIGCLNVTFDDAGNLIQFSGNPLFLDNSIPQDNEALMLLEKFRPEVQILDSQVVGRSRVYLDGANKHCRSVECNFGNLVTDSFVSYKASLYAGKYWTDTPIAITNSGSIRNSINGSASGWNVTRAELLGALPFGVQLVSFKLNGSDLWKVMETSVRSNGETSRGEFLQVSGLHVVYDMSKPTGSRVVSIETRCGFCDIPHYEPLKMNETYSIISTTFITSGGDGYNIIKNKARDKQVEDLSDLDAVSAYVERKSPIYPEVQGRIKFGLASDENKSSAEKNLPILCLILGTIILSIVR